jgi:hypothetical protein
MPTHADLVHENSSSTGTGNLTLTALNGKRRFGTVFGTGGTTNVFWYFISNRDAAEWELGLGHMSDANTLVRDTVSLSSNANAAVNFSAGTKDVVNDVPASGQLNMNDWVNQNKFLGGSAGTGDGPPSFRVLDPTDIPTKSGGMQLLTSGSVSAAATLDIVLTSYTDYRGLKFVLQLVPATDDVDLFLRTSTNGGSSYDASAGNYGWLHTIDGDGKENSSSDTEITIASATSATAGIGNATTEGIVVEVTVLQQTSAALHTKFSWLGAWKNAAATSGITAVYGAGFRSAAQDTDAVRFLFSSGNIASGNYAVYGLI